MSQTVRDKIIEQVDRLSDSQQRQVLNFAERLSARSGVSGQDILRFAGSTSLADLEAMSQAD
jgi:hypothetical protein